MLRRNLSLSGTVKKAQIRAKLEINFVEILLHSSIVEKKKEDPSSASTSTSYSIKWKCGSQSGSSTSPEGKDGELKLRWNYTSNFTVTANGLLDPKTSEVAAKSVVFQLMVTLPPFSSVLLYFLVVLAFPSSSPPPPPSNSC
jgi:hypothetical protein